MNLIAAMTFGVAAFILAYEIERAISRAQTKKIVRQQVGIATLSKVDRPNLFTSTKSKLTVVGILISLITAIVAGPLGIFAGFVPWYIWRSMSKKARRKRSDQLVNQLSPALEQMIGHLAIGSNVIAALSEVSENCADPLGGLLREVLAQVRLGDSLDEVLQTISDRENDRHLGVVASAIGLHSRHGGSLVEILGTVAETIEEEDRLRRDIASLTADGRISAQVLLAMPIIMFVVISLLSPGYTTPLFNSSLGRMLSMSGIVLGTVGWMWLRSLSTPKVTA
jgi:tight adherence protein B